MERTLTILKPDSIRKKVFGDIIHRILEAGFDIVEMRMIKMDEKCVNEFYHVHKGKSFFQTLTNLMTSGNSIVMVLKKENAIKDFREFIGNTDPKKATIGSIRQIYADSPESNIIHGSDSPINAEEEINYFFEKKE